jgi:hypothetical protein
MRTPPIVTAPEWHAARNALLVSLLRRPALP